MLYGNPFKPTEPLLRNKKRFDFHMNILYPHIDSEILCLNEASQEYLTTLQENKKIRETYHMSHLTMFKQDQDHNVAVLAKQSFKYFFVEPRFMFCLFLTEEGPILVIATHYKARENKTKARENEFLSLKWYIEKLSREEKEEFRDFRDAV